MARQTARLHEAAARLDEGHQLTLVVRGAARDDALARRRVGHARREGFGLPEFQWIGGLHVVMSVEQHMRRVAAGGLRVADNHGMTRGFARRGLETDALELIDEPGRGPRAIILVRRIGRDRWNFDQAEQALQRVVEIGVDAREGVVEDGHGFLLCNGVRLMRRDPERHDNQLRDMPPRMPRRIAREICVPAERAAD